MEFVTLKHRARKRCAIQVHALLRMAVYCFELSTSVFIHPSIRYPNAPCSVQLIVYELVA